MPGSSGSAAVRLFVCNYMEYRDGLRGEMGGRLFLPTRRKARPI